MKLLLEGLASTLLQLIVLFVALALAYVIYGVLSQGLEYVTNSESLYDFEGAIKSHVGILAGVALGLTVFGVLRHD